MFHNFVLVPSFKCGVDYLLPQEMHKFSLHTSLVSSNKVRGVEPTTVSQRLRHSEDTGGSPHAALGWTALHRGVPSG